MELDHHLLDIMFDVTRMWMLATVAFLFPTVKAVKVTAGMPEVIADGRYLSIGALSASSLFGAIVGSINLLNPDVSVKKRILGPRCFDGNFSYEFIYALIPAAVMVEYSGLSLCFQF